MHGPHHLQPQGLADASSTEPGILSILWKRKFLIIVVGLIGLGGGYLRYTQQPLVYQSRARVILNTRGQELPLNGVNNAPSATDSLYETLLTSPVIIQRAVDNELRTLSSLKAGDAVSRIMSGLKVSTTTERTGSIVDFSYKGPNGKECTTVLDAIIGAFHEFLDENYKNLSEETITLIAEAKDKLQAQLQEADQQYAEFKKTSPLLTSSGNAINIYEQRLLEIESQRATVLLEITRLNARMQAMKQALESGDTREALTLLVRNNMESDRLHSTELQEVERINTIEQRLLPLMIELETLKETYAENHPKIKNTRLQINMMREVMMNKPVTGEAAESDFFAVYLQSLDQELKILKRQASEYETLFTDQERMARNHEVYAIEDANHKANIGRLNDLYRVVIARLDEIDLVQDNLVRMTVVNPASPGSKVSPVMESELTFGGVLGLLAGCALAYLINIADKRFRNPDDIRTHLGLPVVGHVPVFRATAKDVHVDFAGVDPAIRVVHDPKSGVAEAYRAVRTSLYFSAGGKSHKVVQVTSPHPGDGKTTSAINLAASIAASGTRVLVVDCDMRRPRCHRLLGCHNRVGVSNVVVGEAEFAEALQTTNVPNLDMLASGTSVDTPAELLTHPRFDELLAMIREKYDLVIIDSPPLLAVTDGTVIAPRVDGVLMVMRLSRSARESGKRATELLASLGAEILGVIINGVGHGDYAYYGQGYSDYNYHGYGSYGYGYNGYEDEPKKALEKPRVGASS